MTRSLTNSPNLTEILLAHITNEGLRLIASHCGPSLRTIALSVSSNSLKPILYICRACPNLRSLTLRTSELNGDPIVPAVVQYCPSIEHLSTEWWDLTDAGLDTLATIHTLTQLKVSAGKCTSAAIQRVLRANPNLAYISVDTAVVGDALLRCIGDCCRIIKRLEWYRLTYHSAPTVSNSALQDLFRGCPLLEAVRLHLPGGKPTATLRALFQYCHHLTDLHLDIDYLSSAELQVMCSEPILYAYYPTLTKLSVNGDGVSDSALRDIFTYCINIHTLNLRDCTHVTDATITALAQNCCCLDTLTLDRCKNITIAGVLEVASHRTNLTSLTLKHMPVSDELLIKLSLHCRNLIRLHLFDCRSGSISDAGICAVLKECRSLKYVATNSKTS